MGRCFVIDPTCAFSFGHSVNSIKYFKEIASVYFPDVRPIVSYHLPADALLDGIQVERYFDFYYDQQISIDRAEPSPKTHVSSNISKYMAPANSATTDFGNFLFYNNISSQDVILFPSVDYYSIVGIFSALEGLEAKRCPRLLLRFIGVLENVVENGVENCFKLIDRYVKAGGAASVSAETPKLASRLSALSDCAVTVTPYPAFQAQATPLSLSGPFYVFCGGAARLDKGFYRLADIFASVNEALGIDAVRFIVQGFPPKQIGADKRYLQRLYSIPNVELLDGVIPYSKMLDAYGRSHITILPYDERTYAFRGSAMLMESIILNRLVLAQARTAFADQVRKYNSGIVCDDDEGFADAICLYAKSDRRFLIEQAALAERFYRADAERAYNLWLEGDQ